MFGCVEVVWRQSVCCHSLPPVSWSTTLEHHIVYYSESLPLCDSFRVYGLLVYRLRAYDGTAISESTIPRITHLYCHRTIYDQPASMSQWVYRLCAQVDHQVNRFKFYFLIKRANLMCSADSPKACWPSWMVQTLYYRGIHRHSWVLSSTFKHSHSIIEVFFSKFYQQIPRNCNNLQHQGNRLT